MNLNRLKIIFLTCDCSLQGTYFRWHNWAIGLVNLGHEVLVYSIDNSDKPFSRTEIRDGVYYHIKKSVKGKSVFGVANHPFVAIKRIFGNFPQCDVVHVFQPFLSVYFPWKFKMKNKAKVTFFDWDDLWADSDRDKEKKNFRGKWDYWFKVYLEKKIPSVSKSMTICSRFLKTLAVERGASQVEIIPNGFWAYDVPGRLMSRQKLGLQSNAIYVGFMGRTGFELNWAFKALEHCLQQGIEIRFALCGPEANILDDISELARSHTDYLGSLAPADTRYFAAAVDLGLLPLMKTTFNESRFPIKFAEYLAAGLPVLCSEVGEVNEYGKNFPWVIKAGVNENDWVKHFMQAVKMLVNNELVPVDRQVVSDNLSWQKIAGQLENLYLIELQKVV